MEPRHITLRVPSQLPEGLAWLRQAALRAGISPIARAGLVLAVAGLVRAAHADGRPARLTTATAPPRETAGSAPREEPHLMVSVSPADGYTPALAGLLPSPLVGDEVITWRVPAGGRPSDALPADEEELRALASLLLTSLAVNAMRNARRAGIGLADQASLTDQAIYAEYRGTLHVGTLLLDFDLETGKVAAVDAGSPRMLRVRGSHIEPVPFDAQLPLGMFDRTQYIEQHFVAQPGDRYVIVSDGVHSARTPGGEEYGTGAHPGNHRQPAHAPARSRPRDPPRPARQHPAHR